MSMTNHAVGIWTCTQVAWQFRVISIRPNGISKLDREFPSWSLRKKRRISRSYCSGPRDRSNQLAEGLHQSKINYGKRFFWLWRIGFDDGARIVMVPRYCLFDLRNYRAWSRDKTKGLKTLAPNGRLKNPFSGRQLGLVQEETLIVLYTRMPRETVRTTWNEVETRKKFSPRTSVLFSTESEETDWRKSLNSLKASLATKLKKSLSVAGKMKKIVVSLSTSSFVSWLQVWKQMHSWLWLPISTSWRWKETQREFEKKKVLKDQLPFWKKKKNVKDCVSQNSDPMSSTFHGKLKNWDWTLRRDTAEILRMHLVHYWIREIRRRSGGII